MGDKHVDGLEDLRALPDEIVLRLIEGQHPVRVWREHRGLTMQDLAALAQIEPGLVAAIESDELPLDDGTAEILSSALGVEPHALHRLVAVSRS
jgi:hypothetical protein